MTDIQELAAPANRLLDGYVHESDVAKALGIIVRTLRIERQHGDGPPWVRIGRDIYYPEAGFRDWLKSIEHRPVRARKTG